MSYCCFLVEQTIFETIESKKTFRSDRTDNWTTTYDKLVYQLLLGKLDCLWNIADIIIMFAIYMHRTVQTIHKKADEWIETEASLFQKALKLKMPFISLFFRFDYVLI